MTTDCTYCGCDIERHDPVFVTEQADGREQPAGRFCNYACLAAHIDQAGLTEGATCEWAPGE